ncbi:MAG: aminotransferase class V-fold PLP-dependent enzyme [Acidimicrobiales bacterium]|nr:aminotransferase class V-fold PLP-dependent enzyme [Acidimicrobiales bacterium]RZV48501.1 MAG: aminotransferase class V-fold PLP-dependent enzyme [Acidimicrobiales bacterium]
MTDLDLHFVRSQFPAFAEASLEGWAFFENAGGSYACRQTIDRLTDFYTKTKVQPYGPYPASADAGDQMDQAHVRLAGLMNVGADELQFGPSTSQNTYVLAHAFRQGWSEGDEIIVTDQDHEANSGVWRRLADSGIRVLEWGVDPDTGVLDPADLANLLSDKTKLVAFPHCSNIVAHINPVAEICAMARAVGATTVVDGVSAAPHGLPDVDALGADIYLFSAYKTYGPHQGVMIVRDATNNALANQSHYFNDGEIHKRLVPAGPDHAQVAALNGVADYIDLLHEHHFEDGAPAPERGRRVHDLMRAQETALVAPLLSYLVDRGDVRIMGPTDPSTRVPTVAFVTEEDPSVVANKLVEHKVMAGAGDFYAVRLVEAMGQPADPGVLRLSFVHYTSPAEVTQAIEALDEVL